jgi:flagellar protein FlaG
MASELLNSVSTNAPTLASRVRVSAVNEPATKAAVTAPKPIDIKFDPAEVRKNIQEAVNVLNQQINEHNRGLGFSIDDSLETPVVTVRSTVTGEVVRQIPNETVVRVAHSIDSIKGLLINANV